MAKQVHFCYGTNIIFYRFGQNGSALNYTEYESEFQNLVNHTETFEECKQNVTTNETLCRNVSRWSMSIGNYKIDNFTVKGRQTLKV